MSPAIRYSAAAAAVVLAAAAGYGFSRMQPPAPTAEATSGLEARLDAQAERQAELERRFDRLILELQTGAAQPAARPAGAGPVQARTALTDSINRANQAGAQAQQQLEQQLRNEPLDPAWALATTRTIETALSAEGLAEIGAQPPLDSQIECRSSICRIEMIYATPADVGEAGVMLGMAVGENLPFTRSHQITLPDGSTQLVVYASRNRY